MNIDRRTMTISPNMMRRVAAITLAGVLSSQLVVASAPAASAPNRIAMMDDKEMGSMGGGPSGNATPGMSGMSSNPSGGMGGMSGNASGGMDAMGCCMGSMGQAPGSNPGGGGGMSMQTNLPGFPGASHIYHVGATGFYLEYADKLGLSTDQKKGLNDIKQRALVDQSNQQRSLEQAEQALWLLTAAEQPDSAAVESKIREIEKLNADQRLGFIRAVGEAAKVLTEEQRKMVLGLAPMPASSSSSPKQMNMGK